MSKMIFYEQLRGPYTVRRPSTPIKFAPIKKYSFHNSGIESDLAQSALTTISRKVENFVISESPQPPIPTGIFKRTLKNSRHKSISYSKGAVKSEAIVLYDNCKDQPDVIMQHLLKGETFCKNEAEILNKWIYTLPQEIRMEIEIDKKYFPIPRNIDAKSINEGLNQLYGKGSNRRLRPGEEASIMETIRRFLEQSPTNLGHSVGTILQEILRLSGLHDLINYPFCMKQVECHWKLMATRFRYSGNAALGTKKAQKYLAMAAQRGHFLDLNNQKSILIQYLLRYSSQYQQS